MQEAQTADTNSKPQPGWAVLVLTAPHEHRSGGKILQYLAAFPIDNIAARAHAPYIDAAYEAAKAAYPNVMLFFMDGPLTGRWLEKLFTGAAS